MAVVTKDQLKAQSNTTFKDNNNGEIEPSGHRAWNDNLVDSMATNAQGAKADTAIQTATVGGAAVPKSGTALQFPAYATAAQGTKADTAIQTATVNGVAVPKSGTTLQFPALGQDLVTFIIDNQAKFTAWVNNTAGNDYTIVYIKKGTYTATKGVDLTATKTKRIYGAPGNKIQITGAAYAFYYKYNNPYTEKVSHDSDFSIEGLYVEGYNITGGIIQGCSNVKNCFVKTDGTNNNKCFLECFNLSGCSAYSLSGTDSAGFSLCAGLNTCYGYNIYSAFLSCTDLTNCVGESAQVGYEKCLYLSNCRAQDSYYGFETCQSLTNCYSYTTMNTGFYGCTKLTGCRSIANAFNGFFNCNYLTSCEGDGVNFGYNICNFMMMNKATGGTRKYENCYVVSGGVNVANTAAGGFNN